MLVVAVLPGVAVASWLPASSTAPHLSCRLKGTLQSRSEPISLLARKAKAPKVEEEEEEYDYEAAERDSQSPLTMVNPMSTSLGYEEELEPFPGPNVADVEEKVEDVRPVFCHLGMFDSGMIPGEGLQAAYHAWLQQEEMPAGVVLSLPHYLLAAQSFDTHWEGAEVLTDDDIARLDAEEEAAAAAAAAAAEVAEAAEAAEGSDEAPDGPDPDVEVGMELLPMPFVLGHLTVARASSWAAASAWASTDPVALAGGYSPASGLHQWLVSDDEALNIRPTGDEIQSYAVHCLDHEGQTSLRANTREKHLAWLRESGRVQLGGPLLALDDSLSASAEGKEVKGAGPRVGTLVIVSGDSLEDVQDWAAADPYQAVGLFRSVTVAPLNTYDVDGDLNDPRE